MLPSAAVKETEINYEEGALELARQLFGRQPADTINQLIRRGGQEWWRRFGNARSMNFDLADDSEMMSLFRDYLNEKGITQE